MQRYTLGIIGGMGPLATADLLYKIIQNTQAQKDCEHIPIVMDHNPKIPDRTQAILGNGTSPLPDLICAGKRLQKMGADLLLLPCNTCHHYYVPLRRALKAPLLHLVLECVREVVRKGHSCVGLLATQGTVACGIYQNLCAAHRITVLLPDQEEQRIVSQVIYEKVKAGQVGEFQALLPILERLRACGAQSILLGCTELALAFGTALPDDCIDSNLVLARAAILRAGYALK